jgi:hypothetical protein
MLPIAPCTSIYVNQCFRSKLFRKIVHQPNRRPAASVVKVLLSGLRSKFYAVLTTFQAPSLLRLSQTSIEARTSAASEADRVNKEASTARPRQS